MKELLRVDEVAVKLNTSKNTIYRLINDIENPLPASKIRGQIRVRVEDLEQYIEKTKMTPWK